MKITHLLPCATLDSRSRCGFSPLESRHVHETDGRAVFAFPTTPSPPILEKRSHAINATQKQAARGSINLDDTQNAVRVRIALRQLRRCVTGVPRYTLFNF